MSNQLSSSELLNEAAKIFKVLSNPSRLSILYYLRNTKKEVTVTELVTQLNESQPIISKQLRILTAYNLVKKHKDRTFVYYSLTDPDLINLIDSMVEHVGHTIKESGKVPDTMY